MGMRAPGRGPPPFTSSGSAGHRNRPRRNKAERARQPQPQVLLTKQAARWALDPPQLASESCVSVKMPGSSRTLFGGSAEQKGGRWTLLSKIIRIKALEKIIRIKALENDTILDFVQVYLYPFVYNS